MEKCQKICIAGFEKYLRDNEEEDKHMRKREEVGNKIKEIAKKTGKEWKISGNKDKIWRFIGAISGELKEVREDSIKKAGVEYCNTYIEKMNKKWFVPDAEYIGIIAEILGLDEELKKNICSAVARYYA